MQTEEPPKQDEEAPQVVDPRLRNEIEFVPDNADAAAVETIGRYQTLALKFVDQSARLLVEPSDEKGVAAVLRESRVAMDADPAVVDGTKRTYDVGSYDIKCSGEAVTHPHLRLMSFRSEHYAKLTRGFLRSFLPADNDQLTKDNIPENALVCCYDAGKPQGLGVIKLFTPQTFYPPNFLPPLNLNTI